MIAIAFLYNVTYLLCIFCGDLARRFSPWRDTVLMQILAFLSLPSFKLWEISEDGTYISKNLVHRACGVHL